MHLTNRHKKTAHINMLWAATIAQNNEQKVLAISAILDKERFPLKFTFTGQTTPKEDESTLGFIQITDKKNMENQLKAFFEELEQREEFSDKRNKCVPA